MTEVRQWVRRGHETRVFGVEKTAIKKAPSGARTLNPHEEVSDETDK